MSHDAVSYATVEQFRLVLFRNYLLKRIRLR